MISLVLLILAFLALSGVLAMIDAAILSVSRAEVEELVLLKKGGSSALLWVTRNLTKSVVVIVIATNVINILGPILAGQKAIALFGNEAIGVITAVLTFGTIVFSEIIPKSLGAHYAPTVGRFAAPLIAVAIIGLYPLVIVLEKLAKYFQSGKRVIGTEAQIRSLVKIGGAAGHIEADETQLIQRAFVLNDRLARDIMIPRKDIAAIAENLTIREAADVVFKHHYSRYPTHRGNMDEISGIVMSKDILLSLAAGRDSEPVKELARDALLVPASKKADDLLVLFRNRAVHLAIVRDQEKTVGLVTLEDVLEELVGEIEDETDVETTAK